MKKPNLFLILLAASVFGAFACTEEDQSAESSSSNESATNAIAQTVCPVSGEELGSMGEPVVVTHEGKEVKLCCKSCIKKFNADPATYTAKVHGS